MKELKGTKTEKNLQMAFAGESQARNKYTYFASKAKKEGYDFFATTLTVSPHKNAQIINAIGERIASEQGVKWLPSDWKKRNGYRRSVELSSALSLYRQDWCGCDFSRRAYDD